jgi:hypothetical protein
VHANEVSEKGIQDANGPVQMTYENGTMIQPNMHVPINSNRSIEAMTTNKPVWQWPCSGPLFRTTEPVGPTIHLALTHSPVRQSDYPLCCHFHRL